MLRILPIISLHFSLILLTINQCYAESKKFQYKINVGIQALSIDSNKVRAKLWSVKPRFKAQYFLNEDSAFHMDFGASLETGSNRSFVIDEYTPKREFYVSKAYFEYNFFSKASLEVGAINQEIYHSPIFLEYLAFVGARERFQFNLLGIDFEIFAQQAIPNNQQLSERVSIIEKGTPMFYAETLQAGVDLDNLRILMAYTHFMFKNIPSKIAYQSRYLGNTATVGNEDSATFVYDYQGHNSALMLSYRSPNFLVELQGQYLHNNYAPNSKADAYFAGLYFGKPTLFAHIERYIIENDATIAYFNSGLYGHTNRDGHAIGFTMLFDQNTELTSLYHIQDIIDQDKNIHQNKRDMVTVVVSKEF